MTMRRWATWVLLGGLAALGAVAIADALRGSPTTGESQAPTISVALIPRNEPASSAMSGVLYYSNATDECRLDGLRLPDLENAPPPKLRSCRFSVSPDGDTALPGDVAWSPDGQLFARQIGSFVELNSIASANGLRLFGHAPAFKPDGRLTYVRGTRVVECPARDVTSLCERTVARFPGRRVLSLAWLSDTRLAAITKGSRYALEIRERRLRVTIPGGRLRMEDLRVSPRGSFVSVRAEGMGGLIVVGADGRPVAASAFTVARSIAWSPDERWTAQATPGSVLIFRTDTGEARVRRLPIIARDLSWR
jgi:hypothetical protein